MTVTIELSPDVEASLRAMAAALGLAVPQLVQSLLEKHVSERHLGHLSPAEKAAAWRASVVGLPIVPPLSEEAISRDAIYDPRC